MTDDWQSVKHFSELFNSGKFQAIVSGVPAAAKATNNVEVRAELCGLLAGAHCSMENFDSSINSATNALKLAPSLRHIHQIRVVSLYRSGRIRAALTDADRLINREPDYALAYYQRALCNVLIANEVANELKAFYVKRAHVDINHAIALDGADADFQRGREIIESLLGPRYANADSSLDGWKLAGNIAEVAGKLLGGALGL